MHMDPSEEEDRCLICLQKIEDRAILPQCSHDSQCFSCILEWTKHSSKCPLCVTDIGNFIIHKVRSKHDYQRYFIAPSLSPKALAQSRSLAASRGESNAAFSAHVGDSRLQREEMQRRQETDAAIMRRRHIYANCLFAKHVATNRYTGYTSHPTPAQVAASIELQRRARAFLRRELQVLDLRSESGIKLLADLMDPSIPYSEETRKPNTEHLAHELCSFLRSPYKQVEAYDEVVQYDSYTPSSHIHGHSRGLVSHRRQHSTSPDGIQARRAHHNERKTRMDGNHSIPKEARDKVSHFPDSGAAPPNSRKTSPIPSTQPEVPVPSGKDHITQEEHVPIVPSVRHEAVGPDRDEDAVDNQAGLMKKIRLEIARKREMESTMDLEHNVDSPTTMTGPIPGISSMPGHFATFQREELLVRLQTEKARLEGGQTAEVGPTITEGTGSGLQIRGAASKAKILMETRLKSQALLRVRLAREKSDMAGAAVGEDASLAKSGELLGLPDTVKDLGSGGKGVISADERQQILRQKLLRERLLAKTNVLKNASL